MAVIPSGSFNQAAVQVPGVTVQIVPPNLIANGVPTDIILYVGTAIGGPVNSPTVVGNPSQYTSIFGPLQTNQYDMGTHVSVAALQGASNFLCIRVTDGTDTAATCNILDTNSVAGIGAILTSRYTGALYNSLQATLTAGSSSTGSAPTFKLTIYTAGQVPEIFDNIGGGTTVFWTNLVNAVNLGQSGIRGPSNYVTAALGANIRSTTITAGGSGYSGTPTIAATGVGGSGFAATLTVAGGAITVITITNHGSGYPSGTTLAISGNGTGATATATIGSNTAPALSTYTFSGGTSGITGVDDDDLVGVDGLSRTGMYAGAGGSASIGVLCDATDSTTWSDQDAFGADNGIYMMLTGPAGQQDGIAAAGTIKQNAGIDSYSSCVLLGNWIYFNDAYNNQVRLVSPQSYKAGLLANRSPQFSALNQKMNGIVATQKSSENRIFSSADLLQLKTYGIDVIQNPPFQAASNIYACALGINASSNPVANTDDYTRVTNFIAYSLQNILANFVGLPQTDDVRRQARNVIQVFLQGLASLGIIGDVNNQGGQPYSVVLDVSNNPSAQVALGFMTADVVVVKWTIIQNVVVNLQVGSTGTVTIANPTPNV